jgi:hypothetical protein
MYTSWQLQIPHLDFLIASKIQVILFTNVKNQGGGKGNLSGYRAHDTNIIPHGYIIVSM